VQSFSIHQCVFLFPLHLNPLPRAFSDLSTSQVCYDDDADLCQYVIRDLPKVLLDDTRKAVETPAKAWVALGLSAAFVKVLDGVHVLCYYLVVLSVFPFLEFAEHVRVATRELQAKVLAYRI